MSFEKLAGIVDNLFLLRLICVRPVRFPKLFGRLTSLLLVITSDHESDERFPKLSGSVVRLLLRSLRSLNFVRFPKLSGSDSRPLHEASKLVRFMRFPKLSGSVLRVPYAGHVS